jgi:2-polyprenyl-6-methoxyphenol hydroxylase-like FAD-dependent oxidoreductase
MSSPSGPSVTDVKVLVVGAGISGLATALALADRGLDVDLVERHSNVAALGSGITLIGPALRALERLGVVEDCLAAGYRITSFETLDVDGKPVGWIDLPSPDGSDLPGMLGMLRPVLHGVLLRRVLHGGVGVRTGTGPTRILERGDSVCVTFADGDRREYDLVVGADGVRSTVRELVHGPVPLVYRGQGCLRVVLPRHPDVTGEVQLLPLGAVFVGFTPTGEDSMYLYCSAPFEESGWPAPDEQLALVRRLTEPFGGLVAEVRAELCDPARVNLAKFHTVLVPAPWSVGRSVVVGDAAHCPTPQLAAGAAMCLEDAVALAEELDTGAAVPEALVAFGARRYERCRFVVETASLLSHWQTYPGSPEAEHQRVTAEAFHRLAQPF